MSSYALRLVITGGDKQIIINQISEDFLAEENLVLDGLACKGVQFD
jgi:pantothenate kinase type III